MESQLADGLKKWWFVEGLRPALNLWGHFARDCTTKEAPQLLCRWCGPGDYEDTKCPKQSVNLLSIETFDENVLAITREQARKAKYPNVEEEKERL